MKSLSMRLDDYLIDLIESEAGYRNLTKVEVIRAAIINYFIHREDIQDIALAESRLGEKDLPFEEAFK